MDNQVSIRIKGIPENESFARSAIAAFCLSSDPSMETISDVRTAVSEAVTNSVVHGYADREGDVLIDAEIKNDVLTVRVIDYGIGIVDVETAVKDFVTSREEDERSGLGFTIMKTYMDTLQVESKLGAGTTVFMTKELIHADH